MHLLNLISLCHLTSRHHIAYECFEATLVWTEVLVTDKEYWLQNNVQYLRLIFNRAKRGLILEMRSEFCLSAVWMSDDYGLTTFTDCHEILNRRTWYKGEVKYA